MTTAVERVAADEGLNVYEVAAAALLARTGCTVRRYRNGNSGTAFTRDDDWGIEVPRPRGPISFGVFAHEVGHQARHRQGSKPRWLEEVEAEEFALACFDIYELKGRGRYEAHAAKHLRYAFVKALKRGADPMHLIAAAPTWWARAGIDTALTRPGASDRALCPRCGRLTITRYDGVFQWKACPAAKACGWSVFTHGEDPRDEEDR